MGCLAVDKVEVSSSLLALWNKKTIASIENQLSLTNDKALKKELKNHLYSTKMVLEGKNNKSIRSEFLKTIFLSGPKPVNFFILEFVQRGEMYEIKNVLVINTENKSKVIFYQYLGDKWHTLRDTTLNRIDLHREIIGPIQSKEIANLAVRDIVLSEFNGTHISSHFYANNQVGKHNTFFGLMVEAINLPYPSFK